MLGQDLIQLKSLTSVELGFSPSFIFSDQFVILLSGNTPPERATTSHFYAVCFKLLGLFIFNTKNQSGF